jgi:hypothetical protein
MTTTWVVAGYDNEADYGVLRDDGMVAWKIGGCVTDLPGDADEYESPRDAAAECERRRNPIPDCVDGKGHDGHDWQTPIEIVGGIVENPGCWGHGGGVILHHVCMRCGCERVEDTWANDDHGGHTTRVTYEPGKHAEAVSRLGER